MNREELQKELEAVRAQLRRKQEEAAVSAPEPRRAPERIVATAAAEKLSIEAPTVQAPIAPTAMAEEKNVFASEEDGFGSFPAPDEATVPASLASGKWGRWSRFFTFKNLALLAVIACGGGYLLGDISSDNPSVDSQPSPPHQAAIKDAFGPRPAIAATAPVQPFPSVTSNPAAPRPVAATAPKEPSKAPEIKTATPDVKHPPLRAERAKEDPPAEKEFEPVAPKPSKKKVHTVAHHPKSVKAEVAKKLEPAPLKVASAAHKAAPGVNRAVVETPAVATAPETDELADLKKARELN